MIALSSLHLAHAACCRRLYWACPFIPAIFRAQGLLAGTLARLGFEGAYCINVVTRLLTLPLRTSLPDFYIIGFPVSDVC